MFSQHLHLTDLFTAGLGFDLAGAFLVARGLVADPAELNRIAGSFYGSNPYQAVSQARDRIDALTGLTALGVGFALQGIGYLAFLGGATSEGAGTGDVVLGAVAMACTAGLTLLAAALYRRFGQVPLIVEMSRRRLDGSRMPYPNASFLPGRLRAYGFEQRADEDELAFVRRTARVKDMIVHVAPLPGGEEQRMRLASEPPLEGERQ